MHEQRSLTTKYGAAQVLLMSKGLLRESTRPKATVALRPIDGKWKVATFPGLYPVDPWEILTGAPGERE